MTQSVLLTLSSNQREHANNSLTDDIPTFDGMSDTYFVWILKLENIAKLERISFG